MSWLTALSKLIDGPYRDKRLGALGETFVRATESNPKYFVLPGGPQYGDLPMSDLGALSAKHGLGLYSDPGRVRGGLPSDWVGVRKPNGENGPAMWADEANQVGRYLERGEHNYYTSKSDEYKQMLDLYHDDKIHHDTKLYDIDSMNADAGTGVGKKGYAALYEYILAHPDAANYSGTLSSNNHWRRSVNMAGALEKWGDRAGDRLLVNSDQLGLKQNPSRILEYGGLPTIGKIGLLNGHVAANVDNQVRQALGNMQGSLGQAYGRERGWSDRMEKLGLKPGEAWDPSIDVEPQHWSDLAGLLREASATAPGADSLRRAAIVAEQMKRPGAKPLDLSDRPDLTTGLARKAGGSV